MLIFEMTKKFPKEETYSLTDQIRRSSRSVCANLAEAWRKRRYKAAFVSKLSDAGGEAAETQVWLQFAVSSGYLEREGSAPLYQNVRRDHTNARLNDQQAAGLGDLAMMSSDFRPCAVSPGLPVSLSPCRDRVVLS